MLSHKGLLTVSSQPGNGTAFHLYFPVLASMAEKASSRKYNFDGQGKTVLFIDDEELIWVTARVMLKSLNFQVIMSDSGEDAMGLLEENPVDLVILDMIMPGLSGKKVFNQIHRQYPELPVILSSGFTKEQDIQDMKESGLAGFINKPYSKLELVKLMSRVFSPK